MGHKEKRLCQYWVKITLCFLTTLPLSATPPGTPPAEPPRTLSSRFLHTPVPPHTLSRFHVPALTWSQGPLSQSFRQLRPLLTAAPPPRCVTPDELASDDQQLRPLLHPFLDNILDSKLKNDVVRTLTSMPPEERRQFIRSVTPYLEKCNVSQDPTVLSKNQRIIIFSIAKIAPSEREALMGHLYPFLIALTDPSEIAEIIEIRSLPFRQKAIEERAARAHVLARMGDRENVMDRDSAVIEGALKVLYQTPLSKADAQKAFVEVKAYIAKLPPLSQFKRLTISVRAGETVLQEEAPLAIQDERENARRVLEGPVLPVDKNHRPISLNELYTTLYMGEENETEVRTRDVLARVWVAIHRYQDLDLLNAEQEQKFMREALVLALGKCVEDDQGLVCNVGKIDRLLRVLQGRIKGIQLDRDVPTFDAFFDAYLADMTRSQDPVVRTLAVDRSRVMMDEKGAVLRKFSDDEIVVALKHCRDDLHKHFGATYGKVRNQVCPLQYRIDAYIDDLLGSLGREENDAALCTRLKARIGTSDAQTAKAPPAQPTLIQSIFSWILG